MKGGLAASIIAAESFIAARPDWRGAIEISATADEESGGYGGVAYLAERGYFSPDRVQWGPSKSDRNDGQAPRCCIYSDDLASRRFQARLSSEASADDCTKRLVCG